MSTTSFTSLVDTLSHQVNFWRTVAAFLLVVTILCVSALVYVLGYRESQVRVIALSERGNFMTVEEGDMREMAVATAERFSMLFLSYSPQNVRERMSRALLILHPGFRERFEAGLERSNHVRTISESNRIQSFLPINTTVRQLGDDKNYRVTIDGRLTSLLPGETFNTVNFTVICTITLAPRTYEPMITAVQFPESLGR